jgi:hypothetical protein
MCGEKNNNPHKGKFVPNLKPWVPDDPWQCRHCGEDIKEHDRSHELRRFFCRGTYLQREFLGLDEPLVPPTGADARQDVHHFTLWPDGQLVSYRYNVSTLCTLLHDAYNILRQPDIVKIQREDQPDGWYDEYLELIHKCLNQFIGPLKPFKKPQ